MAHGRRLIYENSSTNPSFIMQEFEIYLPTALNDGTPIAASEIQPVKETLAKTFGGYTHLKQRSEGAWRVG